MLISKVMEHGWDELLKINPPPDGPAFSISREGFLLIAKSVFYAGAEHVLNALINNAAMEENDELGDDDRNKVDAILAELEAFRLTLDAKVAAVLSEPPPLQ